MKVYLDVCCLNRPFDDQRQPRIRLESEAIALILEQFDAGKWRMVSSEMILLEVAAMPDRERRRRVRALLPGAGDTIRLTPGIFRRAEVLVQRGLKTADAVHVAAAERQGADVLLTCDDRLCSLGRRLRKTLRVKVVDPVSWLREVQDASNA